MKVLSATLATLFLSFIVYGFSPPPAWNRVEGKTIGFFKGKGFEFSVDRSMAHHSEKPTVEISILIPERFTDATLTNQFDSVTILNEDISTEVGTHSHAGKKRAILTMSEAMTQKSQLLFYFRNGAKNVTHGSMYVMNLARVVDDWKKGKKKDS